MNPGIEIIAEEAARRVVTSVFCARCPKRIYMNCYWGSGEPKCTITDYGAMPAETYRTVAAEIDRLNNVKQNNMAIHTLRTSLKGLKKWAWWKNLNGFFTVNGNPLSDAQVRTIVEWAINKGYKYDADIPEAEVVELLGLNDQKQK